ncbi:nitroreductase family protein [Clostridium vincentii]
MEILVLYARSIGLGTCWMAGTFKRSEFHKAMDIT